VTPAGDPGPFVPSPAAGTGPQIEAAKDVWKELKQTFEICQAAEKALSAQIVEAIDPIDPIDLRALLNRATGQCSTSICAPLLFSADGKIAPQQAKAKEMELHDMHFDVSQLVDTVFSSINDLSECQAMMDFVRVERGDKRFKIACRCLIFESHALKWI
jgi:hypothetical protein